MSKAAKQIDVIQSFYLSRMELMQLTKDIRPFYAEAFEHEEVTYFRIYQANEYRFTMGLNERKIWESVEEADQDLVRKLGALIENKVM